MREPFVIGGIEIRPGQAKDVKLRVSEQVTSSPVFIPVTVFHGRDKGPRVFITAAIHGDEINGVEMVRRIRAAIKPGRVRGTIILVPIANPISFMMQSRDLPDGRDLNRCFPGNAEGSMASQIANAIFTKVVEGADYGIDIHTAARGRTNYPHVRGDMRDAKVKKLAKAFGGPVLVNIKGRKGMLRFSAVRRGIPTILYEAGETLKFQKRIVEVGVKGIRNVLALMKNYPFAAKKPGKQVTVRERKWVRAERGGILMLNVRPGDIIEKGDVVAVNTKPYGKELNEIRAPFRGMVVGTTTVPMVHPGSAICHLVSLGAKHKEIKKALRRQGRLFE